MHEPNASNNYPRKRSGARNSRSISFRVKNHIRMHQIVLSEIRWSQVWKYIKCKCYLSLAEVFLAVNFLKIRSTHAVQLTYFCACAAIVSPVLQLRTACSAYTNSPKSFLSMEKLYNLIR